MKMNIEIHQLYKAWLDRPVYNPVTGLWEIETIWRDEFENIVVTAGKNKYLDATLKTGLASPLWYGLLKDTGTPDVGDTLAIHGTWTENQTYSNATRPTWTPGAISAGSVDNSASPMAFTINGSTTIYGAGLCDNAVKATVTGVLLGAGNFTSERAVLSGDTLNVTVTCTIS